MTTNILTGIGTIDARRYLTGDWNYDSWLMPVEAAPTPGPRKPAPVLPVECWNETSVDPDAAMRAVRALCGG